MQVVILAGGYGTRFGNLTERLPKPMIKVHEFPILIHVMNIYSKYNHTDFFIALGYKGKIIKDFFKNFSENKKKSILIEKKDNYEKHFLPSRNWHVNLIDTGQKTMTGGRLKKVFTYLKKDTFFLTYGDGVSNINLKKLLSCHFKSSNLVTLTAVHPPARFGEIKLFKNEVISFEEKPQLQRGWINGGFFVIEPNFRKYLGRESTVLEREPMSRLVLNKKLGAYKHNSFWQCMDTKRDLETLEKIYDKKTKTFKVK